MDDWIREIISKINGETLARVQLGQARDVCVKRVCQPQSQVASGGQSDARETRRHQKQFVSESDFYRAFFDDKNQIVWNLACGVTLPVVRAGVHVGSWTVIKRLEGMRYF